MQYRKLGKTNEMVSILGFGCMRFPVINNDNSQIDEEKAMILARHAIDNGINYLDTAYPYHGKSFSEPGNSETFVAKIIQDGYREKVKIATKLPTWLVNSQDDMYKLLDEQLERLGVDCIDFYLMHSLNKANWEKIKKFKFEDFVERAKAAGKIKHIGFSYHDDKSLFKKIVDDYDWSFCQIQYNYLDEDFQAGKSGFEYAAAKGLGIIIMEPLRGGKMVRGLPPEAEEVFKTNNPLRSNASWAFNWLWNHNDVHMVLSGMSKLEELKENLIIANETEINILRPDEIEKIEKVKEIFKSRIQIPCTSCNYCMPCPSGVNIPKNLSFYNEYFLFDSEENRTRIKTMYHLMQEDREKSINCIKCGKCENHCPQKIKIVKEMENINKLFSKNEN